LVDDEASNIQVLAETLRSDYEVFFALDGERTLKTVKEQNIDLILLDVMLPDIDGFEILQRLKQDNRTRDIPVIFVTSRDDIEDETRGLQMGAVDYVSKPFRPAVVLARINTHLALKRQRELLEQHAFIDGLTEIGNRRQFDTVLSQRWRALLRSGAAIGLVMLDIDHFKDYNDHYGHAVGDRCLKCIAACLADCFSRADDVVTRYGGEEFAIIVNAEQESPFRLHLQQLLEAINGLRIEHACSTTAQCITVSAGAIRMLPQPDSGPKQLIEAADRLLYRAKKDGRDRCWYRDNGSELVECLTSPAG
jgi:diguanylate cyclase (GGDEF)-like protein